MAKGTDAPGADTTNDVYFLSNSWTENNDPSKRATAPVQDPSVSSSSAAAQMSGDLVFLTTSNVPLQPVIIRLGRLYTEDLQVRSTQ